MSSQRVCNSFNPFNGYVVGHDTGDFNAIRCLRAYLTGSIAKTHRAELETEAVRRSGWIYSRNTIITEIPREYRFRRRIS